MTPASWMPLTVCATAMPDKTGSGEKPEGRGGCLSRVRQSYERFRRKTHPPNSCQLQGFGQVGRRQGLVGHRLLCLCAHFPSGSHVDRRDRDPMKPQWCPLPGTRKHSHLCGVMVSVIAHLRSTATPYTREFLLTESHAYGRVLHAKGPESKARDGADLTDTLLQLPSAGEVCIVSR